MKRIINIVAVAALACFAAGCMKDNGNYDYSVMLDGAIGVAVPSSSGAYGAYEFAIGEEVVIEPIITVKDETLKPEDMEYTWYLGAAVISHDPILRLDGLPVGNYRGALTVTDTRYGVIYNRAPLESEFGNTFSLNITSEFTHGFAVLSNDGGASKLGYIRYRNEVWEDFIDNVYALSNEGEELGGEPVNLVYHHYIESMVGGTYYALQINQNGGIGPVDVMNAGMQRAGYVEREFIGGYPEGLRVRDMIYKDDNVFLLSEQGDVYVAPQYREGWMDVLPHRGKFTGRPIYVDGGMRITKWVHSVLQNMMNNNTPVMILSFDDLNKRMLTINSIDTRVSVLDQFTQGDNEAIKVGDPGTDGTTQNSLTFPSPANLSGYEMTILGAYKTDISNDSDNCNVVAVLKKDNKYYCLIFTLWTLWGGGLDIDLVKFFEFPVQNIDADVQYGVNLAGEPHLFFTANGNRDLCLMNLETNAAKVVYTHSAPITAIQAGETSNAIAQMMVDWGMPDLATYGAYHNMLAIGGEDGKVIILNVANVGTGSANILKTYETQSGPIVDIEYLSMDWMQATTTGTRAEEPAAAR